MLQENLLGLAILQVNNEDTVNDYFSLVSNDPHVELNNLKYTVDDAGAAVVVVNMDCPPCSCVIDMYKHV